MGERGLLPLGLPQHGLAQAPLTPLTHADAQECREGANDINGRWLGVKPQQKVSAVRVGKGICVLSPSLWEQGGQLELSSWKEAEGAFERP